MFWRVVGFFGGCGGDVVRMFWGSVGGVLGCSGIVFGGCDSVFARVVGQFWGYVTLLTPSVSSTLIKNNFLSFSLPSFSNTYNNYIILLINYVFNDSGNELHN